MAWDRLRGYTRFGGGPPLKRDLNEFLWKISMVFQIITYWESKFEKPCRTATSAKKCSKIFQRLLHIFPKSLSGGGFGWLGSVLGGSWGVLGRLGASWGVLGRPEGVLGASWGHLGGVLGSSWGPLGASWGRLGGILGRLGGVLGEV